MPINEDKEETHMKIIETKAEKVNGAWQRVTVDEYEVEVQGNRLVVDGASLPLEFSPSWSFKALKSKILTNYEPEEFIKHFFEDDFWRDKMFSICQHVRKYGRAA